MIRLLLYVLIVYLAYRLLKSWGSSFLKSGKDDTPNDGSRANTDLIKDPHCGTYFLKQRGVEASMEGKRLYFCSTECRNEYLKHRGPV